MSEWETEEYDGDIQAQINELRSRIERIELDIALLGRHRLREPIHVVQIPNEVYERVKRRPIKDLPDIATIDGQVTVDEAIEEIQTSQD
jgi:hypothetical protein